MRVMMVAIGFGLLAGAGVVSACSDDAENKAKPSCVEPTTGSLSPRTVTVSELTCSNPAHCTIECRCRSPQGSLFEASQSTTCEDGICKNAARDCQARCAENGGEVYSLRDLASGVKAEVTSGGPVVTTSSSSTSGGAPLGGTSASSSGGTSASGGASPPCKSAASSSSSSSSTSGVVTPGTGTSGTSGVIENDPILCDSKSNACICTRTSSTNPNGNETTPCSTESIGGGRCCGSSQWPSSGSCTCNAAPANCHKSGALCICGLAAPGSTDTVVGSCTGKVCCREPGDIAPTCACHDDVDSCVLGGTQVPSCSTADLQCENKTVGSCR